MIGILQGSVFSKTHTTIIIMVNGVGYRVSVPLSTLDSFSKNDNVTLHIYTHVRKDSLELFGFQKETELRLFELVIAISGIGPKRALLIIDKGVEYVEKAVIDGDVVFFTAIPRLGKKNAQKIIIELKSKLGDTGELNLSHHGDKEHKEFIDALQTLGFKRREIVSVIPKISSEKQFEMKIKKALTLLGKA